MTEQEWTFGIIASSEHVLRLHTCDPGAVSKFAGHRIRVRPVGEEYRKHSYTMSNLGCTGTVLEVHPDDTKELWPNMEWAIICDCRVLVD